MKDKYIWIKVGRKIEVLLRPRLTLIRDGLPDLKLPLVYEKILDLCYYYGIIGHEIKECDEWFKDKERGLPVDVIQVRRGFGKNMREKNSLKNRNDPQGIVLPHQMFNQNKKGERSSPVVTRPNQPQSLNHELSESN